MDIPLKIEILTSSKDDEYLITSPREIEFVLLNIVKHASRIALYFSEADDFILTTLLAVNSTGLWLDLGPTKNNAILNADKLIFVSSHSQIKVQFTADRATETTFEGHPALFLKLPESIYRLQRREYFRLTTPVANPLLCVIPNAQTTEHHQHEVTIMDISGGGVGLTCEEQDAVLVPGHTYQNCKIDLFDIGEFTGTIEVKNMVVLSTKAGNIVRRAGCEFKDLDGPSTIMLQRYVTAMQRAKVP